MSIIARVTELDAPRYRFKVRIPPSRSWRQTRRWMTEQEARNRYGNGNYELLPWTRQEIPPAISANELRR